MHYRMEQLESRCLAGGLADWPAGLGFAADLFVDGGARLSSKSLAAEVSLLGWTSETLLTSSSAKTRATIGGNAADQNGALLFPDGQPRVKALYVNGGKAVSHGSALGVAGRQAIVDFVLAGGSYTGSCAGAFLIGDYSSKVLHLWEGDMEANGTGKQSVSFADVPEHPVAEYLLDHGVDDLLIESVPHIGGPRFSEDYRHPEKTEFVGEILSGVAKGTPYLLEYQPTPESGLIVVQPSHPEYGRTPEQTILMAGILNYAASQAQQIPDLKGSLTVGKEVWAGVRPEDVLRTENVGDGQYHRYVLSVADGTSSLTVQLRPMSGANVDLYVQHESYAHATSYYAASVSEGTVMDQVTIESPVSGTWHVSVYGAHTQANGAAYVLSLV